MCIDGLYCRVDSLYCREGTLLGGYRIFVCRFKRSSPTFWWLEAHVVQAFGFRADQLSGEYISYQLAIEQQPA